MTSTSERKLLEKKHLQIQRPGDENKNKWYVKTKTFYCCCWSFGADKKGIQQQINKIKSKII